MNCIDDEDWSKRKSYNVTHIVNNFKSNVQLARKEIGEDEVDKFNATEDVTFLCCNNYELNKIGINDFVNKKYLSHNDLKMIDSF